MRAQPGSSQCSNTSCPSYSSSFATEPHFNMPIALADHTAGLEGVRLTGKAAADLLRLTVRHEPFSNAIRHVTSCKLTYQCACTLTQPEEFLNSSPEQRLALKHSLQLERFKVYFQVKFKHTCMYTLPDDTHYLIASIAVFLVRCGGPRRE